MGPAAIGGAAIGGIAAGNLWTAQGAYFGETVRVYIEITGMDSKEVTSTFAGYFAFCYLSFEVATKLLSSLLYLVGSDALVYSVFSILAVGSAIGMVFIRDMSKIGNREDSSGDEKKSACTSEKACGAVGLLTSDKKMILMYPACMSFGVLAGFLNYYVNGTIVKDSIGKNMVGYLGATVAGVAAVTSLVFGRFANAYGKGPLVILGQLCFFMEAAF